MATARRQPLPSDGLNLGLVTIPNQILLQISTVPVLTALVVGKAVAETVQAIGQNSEEVFRGDRLPILPFPTEIE